MKRFLIICFLLTCLFSKTQNNIDFESTPAGTYTSANAVSGWTISSQTSTSCNTSSVWVAGSPEFSIITTPQLNLPFVGNLPNSYLGGTRVAQLNNTTANASVTRLQSAITVTGSASILLLAYAGAWEDGGHSCCSQAKLRLNFYDASGAPVTCPAYTLAGVGCTSPGTYCLTTGTAYTNWQILYVDLFPFFGTTITAEVIANDCTVGDHYGTFLIDAKLSSDHLDGFAALPPQVPAFCLGSSIATIYGPLGYTQYSWSAPAAYPISMTQATLSTLTLTNAVAGSVYTLNAVSPGGGCIKTFTYMLTTTTVNIAASGSNSTCPGGSTGSATVIAQGSGTGYTYNWISPSNGIVSMQNTAFGLGPGIYTVVVKAAGSQSNTCGTATTTVSVSAGPRMEIPYLKPYCTNGSAYLSAPAGSNYQWYNNFSPITGSLGTASSYTVTSPCNNCIYRLNYTSPIGCQDSVIFTLFPTSGGTLSVSHPSLICRDSTNGVAIITLTPAPGSSGLSSYSVISTGTTPSYSLVSSASIFSFIFITNLVGAGTYSINVFDGVCAYSKTVTVPTFSFDYNLSTASPTICSGTIQAANITITQGPGQLNNYSYNWTPSTFLMVTSFPNTFISPVVASGSSITLVYTIAVTPFAINCPLVKTLTITAVNLPIPTVSPIPLLCSNGSSYSISALPSGGTFINSPAISGSNIQPSLGIVGANTFTYILSSGPCSAKTGASFTVTAPPVLSISGNTLVCLGNPATVNIVGADTYTWNNSYVGATFSIIPTSFSTHIVKGTNTLTGCSNTKTISLGVLPNPTLSILGNTLVCEGEITSLIAVGANTFTWNTGSSAQNILVNPGITTTYTLEGTNTAGCPGVKTITVTVLPCTSLTENKSGPESILLYPNPSNGKFSFETQTELVLNISDGLGRTILEQDFEKGKYTLDLKNYPDGTYFVKMFYKDQLKAVKLIKKS